MNRSQMVDRMREKIRDDNAVTFSDDALVDALAQGLRDAYPAVKQSVTVSVGTIAAGASTAPFAAALAAAQAAIGAQAELRGVLYVLGSKRRVSLLGCSHDATTLTFGHALTQDREVLARFEAPCEVPGEFGEFDFSLLALPMVEAYALAELYDGFFAGRIPYDKYSVTAASGAVDPYEVQAAAAHFRTVADAARSRLLSGVPHVRTR